MARSAGFVLLLCALARAQEPCGEGCGDDSGIVIDSGADEGAIDIEVDPFDRPPVVAEPNRPPPVEVGVWQPPDLDDAARREMEDLLRRRGETPDDASMRYRLAEFYLAHGWLPQAEAEFLSCVALDPDSIRPWEGLLRVYGVQADDDEISTVRVVMGGKVISTGRVGGSDWIQPQERSARTTDAWREIVKRRPDDVAKRRDFLNHLKREHDAVAIEAEAREIIARLPGDTDTRFDLAEAVRRRGAMGEAIRKGAAKEALVASQRILEENLAASPGHAPSALRLARILAKLEGTKAQDRIEDLENRAFFHLFVRPDLMPVEFREDTLAMARNLCGPSIARVLWDSALSPRRNDWRTEMLLGEERPAHVQRWIYLPFPNAQPRDQIGILDRLARRGDRDAAGVLLAFLWHLEGPDSFNETSLDQISALQSLETAAVEAAARLSAAAYPGAERFLKTADDPRRRRRAADLVRKLRDPRAVAALSEALAWETDETPSYGIAGALEELGDAKAVPALADAALDPRRHVARRREAAEALAAFKDARSIEAVNRLSKEPGLELVAAYGLFRLTGD
ncbi:MAG: tetratricopeptide repeat protein, partial [Planctomycetota bacterium]